MLDTCSWHADEQCLAIKLLEATAAISESQGQPGPSLPAPEVSQSGHHLKQHAPTAGQQLDLASQADRLKALELKVCCQAWWLHIRPPGSFWLTGIVLSRAIHCVLALHLPCSADRPQLTLLGSERGCRLPQHDLVHCPEHGSGGPGLVLQLPACSCQARSCKCASHQRNACTQSLQGPALADSQNAHSQSQSTHA